MRRRKRTNSLLGFLSRSHSLVSYDDARVSSDPAWRKVKMKSPLPWRSPFRVFSKRFAMGSVRRARRKATSLRLVVVETARVSAHQVFVDMRVRALWAMRSVVVLFAHWIALAPLVETVFLVFIKNTAMTI